MKYLVLLAASGALWAEPLSITQSEWRLWSQREATAPRVSIDNTITRSGKGSLMISGNSNAAVHGGWEHSMNNIKPGTWYRFTAYYKSQGVPTPNWQIVPRLDWKNGNGKRAGMPDYVYKTKQEGEWTKTWLEVPAPDDASSVVLQLHLSHAPSGTVWWDDVSLEEIAPPKDRKIRVATINLRPQRTKGREENVEQFIQAVNNAAPGNMDIILFPEGMTVVGNNKPYTEISEPVPGPTTKRLGELARERNSWVAAGLYESEGNAIYNTAVLLDRKGRLVGKYRKVYLPREEFEGGLAPGNSFPVFDTDFGRIGLMICYDVFFSDPAKALAAQGAEVILLPIWGGDETLAKARAVENRIFLVTSGYDHPTYIMDPYGERVAVAKERGTAAIATIDLNRRYTERFLGEMKQRRVKEARIDVTVPAPQIDR